MSRGAEEEPGSLTDAALLEGGLRRSRGARGARGPRNADRSGSAVARKTRRTWHPGVALWTEHRRPFGTLK
ncbi:hypothetical protein EYF80_062649 [Liparis tanakae]|uniref:Uncharacterized protein n=1 Tax=Liparis tanakae TaxID=230148 RepID=A0A4Z2EEK3_9TELE|nr:hypothetical protein EYF80_062649 [Liparis tanakae]